jgi:hypothetical protein
VSVDPLSMVGGHRVISSKSNGPELLTRLIDLAVWIQSDFGGAERRRISCGIAAYTTMTPTRSPSGTPAEPKKSVLRHDRRWGRAPEIVAGVATPPVNSHEIVVAPGIVQVAPSDSRTSPAEDSDIWQEGSPSPCRRS